MINIFAHDTCYLVWNPNDVIKLRANHRILGSLIGNALRGTFKGVPLKLLPEEAKLLLDKGIVNVVTNPAVSTDEPSPESAELYWSNRNQKCAEQKKIEEANYHDMIREKAENTFAEGELNQIGKFIMKRTPRLQSLFERTEALLKGSEVWPVEDESDSETDSKNWKVAGDDHECVASSSFKQEDRYDTGASTSSHGVSDASEISANQECENLKGIELQKKKFIEKEIAKYEPMDDDSCLIQQFTECVWKKPEENIPVVISFPQTEEEKVKYAVFKDLWEKNHFITSGLKFGGDYLVYPRDPSVCQALYIVKCIERKKKFMAKDVIIYGRVGEQEKKTFVLASVNNGGSVEYLSLNWAPYVMSPQKKKKTDSKKTAASSK